MLFELRTYTLHPGHLAHYLDDFESRGLPVISRYARLVGYWVVEVGELNQVVHIWSYDDAAHRATQRAKLYSDPAWTTGYLPGAVQHIVTQRSALMTAAPFSPLA